MWDNLYFDRVEDDLIHCYYVLDGYRNATMFSKDGCYTAHKVSKCVIFPKGKNSWEGFVPPCKFKDGDIVYVKSNERNEYIIIFKEIRNEHIHKYVCFAYQHLSIDKCALCHLVDAEIMRLATEEEKEKLFDAIKANGYHWNAETKKLEKLPKFKVGDRIRSKKDAPINISGVLITKVNECGYGGVIGDTTNNAYISFRYQDLYELVPNKFDINTLKSFESKVLVRSTDEGLWKPAIYGFSHSNGCYVVGGACWKCCIPYKGNEYLLGTTDDCNDYYKTWE
jgi:hypothetical protein